MLRTLAITAVALVALAGAAYGATVANSTQKEIAGGAQTVAHCKVTRSVTGITTAGVISAVTPTVSCDRTGTYTLSYTLVSGNATRTGAKTVSLTANVPASTTVTVSPTLTVSGKAYSVTWTIS